MFWRGFVSTFGQKILPQKVHMFLKKNSQISFSVSNQAQNKKFLHILLAATVFKKISERENKWSSLFSEPNKENIFFLVSISLHCFYFWHTDNLLGRPEIIFRTVVVLSDSQLVIIRKKDTNIIFISFFHGLSKAKNCLG